LLQAVAFGLPHRHTPYHWHNFSQRTTRTKGTDFRRAANFGGEVKYVRAVAPCISLKILPIVLQRVPAADVAGVGENI
jgi:hypothetical protein